MEAVSRTTGARVSRRHMLKLMGMSAAGAALAACAVPAAPGAAPAAGQPAPAEEKIVIKIDHRGYARGAAEPVLKELIAEWEAQHPKFKIENTAVDYQGMDSQQWTERRLVAGDGPDLLFSNWTYLIEKWMEANLVNFYDDYLVMPNPYVPGNQHWRDQFIVPSARQSNGKTAWVGLDNTTLWFFYNKQIFADLGLEPPKMWPDLITMFKTIQEKAPNLIPCSIYHNLPFAVWTFDAVANQIMYDIYVEITGGSGFEPTSRQVAEFVKAGKYNVDIPEYQESFKIATDWWQYAPKGAFSGGDDQGYQLFLSGKAATRYTGVWENGSLVRDMPGAETQFDWAAFPIPIIPKSMSPYATEKAPKAVFVAGYLLFMIPAYNKGEKLDATIDWLMFLSVPENLGKLMAASQDLVPNIKDVPLPASLAAFAVPDDATDWLVNSWGAPHVNLQGRDAFVRNWQNVLLGQMTIEQYTETMKEVLIQAAEQELKS